MVRLLTFGMLVSTALFVSGCAMCCSPYDEAYGYTGGRWQRTDLCHGRVGSAFAPAGAVSDTVVEPEPAELPSPAPSSDSPAPMKSIKKSSDWSGDLSGDQ